MNDEFAFLKSALSGEFGWGVLFVTWQGLLRSGLGFFNSKIQEFMEQALPQDKEWLNTLLNSRGYRLTNFLINMFLSVKLPSTARKPGSTGMTGVFARPPATTPPPTPLPPPGGG